MNLTVLFRSLPDLARRDPSTFDRARPAQPALASHETTDALLHALSMDSPLPLGERQELVRALVALHRNEPHTLWPTLLLHAFRPMLLSLRARDRGSREDRDGRIIVAFLQALARTPVAGQPVFIALRRATERGLFQAVRKERGRLETVPFGGGDGQDGDLHSAQSPFMKTLAREMATRIVAGGVLCRISPPSRAEKTNAAANTFDERP